MSAPDPIPVVADLAKDAADFKATAFSGAKAEVDAAESVIQKLLTAAAGDVAPLLTDGEAAALTFALSKVPAPYAPEVSAFAQAAAAFVTASVNPLASAAVGKGLAYALAEITAVQHHLDGLL